jgi:hypothetical protein
MATAFIYRLEFTDGTPADSPTIGSAPGVPWTAGDTIPQGRSVWFGSETTTLISRRHWSSRT